MGMGDHFCPYTQQILELVGGGIFFTSFYNWSKIQIISTHGHWLHFHTLASLPGHVLSRQSAWITLHCCKNVQKPCWAKLHTFARIIAFCFTITIIKISPTLFSLVGSEFDPNGCENQLYVNILITYSLWTILHYWKIYQSVLLKLRWHCPFEYCHHPSRTVWEGQEYKSNNSQAVCNQNIYI